MADSQIAIYNLALNAIGARDDFSSLTEPSREVEVCNLWYGTVRDQILSAAPWPEVMHLQFLALLDEADDSWQEGEPRRGYTYVYAVPSDCLRPRYIDDFSRFLLTSRSGVRRLHSNKEEAVLVYTRREELVSIWSPDLQMAIAYGLASHICLPLSGKRSRARDLAERANAIMMQARVDAANSQTEMHETLPDWITARGYNVPQNTRFYYPHGALLSTSYGS